MLHRFKTSLLALSLLWTSSSIIAQTEVSGFFPAKGELTIAPNYSFKSYDKFYRGNTLTDGNPAGFGAISSYIVNLYGEYGITDWLCSSINLPYISVKNENGILDPVQQKSVVEGVQDLSIFLKGRLLSSPLGKNAKVDLGAIAGGIIPVGGYEGRGILSLGNNAISINGELMAQFTIANKVFFELQGGYSYRNNSDYEVPNALIYSLKFGYFNKFIYWHTQIARQDSVDGLTIGTPEFGAAGAAAALPQTEVDFTNFIFNLYFPLYKDTLGISGTYIKTIDGRNFGREASYSIGLVYKPL